MTPEQWRTYIRKHGVALAIAVAAGRIIAWWNRPSAKEEE
jgi:hypothetical protein